MISSFLGYSFQQSLAEQGSLYSGVKAHRDLGVPYAFLLLLTCKLVLGAVFEES